jgi:hypothetical protein
VGGNSSSRRAVDNDVNSDSPINGVDFYFRGRLRKSNLPKEVDFKKAARWLDNWGFIQNSEPINRIEWVSFCYSGKRTADTNLFFEFIDWYLSEEWEKQRWGQDYYE